MDPTKQERRAAGIALMMAQEKPCRVEIGTREIRPPMPGRCVNALLPAGEVPFRLWESQNYAYPLYEERFFFEPEAQGVLVIGGERAVFLGKENLPVLAEKGHFRLLNLSEEPLSIRRRSGAVLWEELAPYSGSDYKMAGMGGYALSFYVGKEKIDEVTFTLSEAEVALIVFTPQEVYFYPERTVK